MFHLDNNSGISSMPAPAAQQSSATRWFTEGGGTDSPSWPGADWFNTVQAELLNVLTAAGIAPKKTQFNQLALAIKAIVSKDALLKTKLLSEIKDVGASAQKKARENLDIVDATLNKKGLVQLNNATDSTSESLAATPKAVKAANDNANTRVPSTRKVNGYALSSDVVLSADDVGAMPVEVNGVIRDGATMAAANKGGWWRVVVTNPAAMSDFPARPNGTKLYGYGYMFVMLSENSWLQHYYSHRGEVAIRQEWTTGPTTDVEWVIDYNTANKPTPEDINALPANGTAVSANKLATARTINGVAFDGTKNISISASQIGSYTKSESDARYTPTGQAYTKAESDSRFNLKNTASKATSGWEKDASTGMITQWGSGTYSKNARITFPVAFPNSCVAVVGNDTGSGVVGTALGSRDKTGFTMYANSTTVSLNWIAKGY